ncbi:MAG: S9 family peptidase [Robiginitomaculum sp.]|nr:S9 family peptidase [Robiginitomaculum sp.]
MRILLTGLLAATALTACNKRTETPISATNTVKVGDLTPAIINSDPSLSGSSLKKARISPDGKMVTVLQGREDDFTQQDLWAYDLATGKGKRLVSSTDLLGAPEVLSAEEKNRRERMREKGAGIVSYSWDSAGKQILFPLGGDVFVYNLESGKAVQVTNTDGFETDARISGSGEFVSYVRDNDLYMTRFSNGRERRLSFGANDLVRNATASFVVQEELARSTGYWVSPTEMHIAYSQIDESPIAVEHRIEYSADGIENVAQRYPFAGTDNATVKLAIKPLLGGDAVWADIGDDKDIYLARVYWSKNGRHMYVAILSRDQKSLKMLDVDPATGTSRLVFEETSKTWINVRGDFKALDDGGFLWSSERSGFWHIYRYGQMGKPPVQITKGEWPVSKVNCIDEAGQKIYFTGWQDTALEQHIYSIGFNGDNLTQLSKGAGIHSASFATNCSAYIGTSSTKSSPPQTRAYKSDGTPLIWLNENKLDSGHAYAPYLASHVTPEFGQLAAADGTMMDYMLYKPADIKPGEKRPAVTIVYGGPGVQRVDKGWNSKIFLAQMLADNGFVVFQMDNRGATKRGKVFEDHLYRSMGKTEVIDQSVGAEFLKNLPYVDAERMGVYGWSYGGYMTLHMLAQTDHYKAGVSGAPVTDWALYDTAYTERFLGDPRSDNINYTKGAYETASVFPHLDGLTEPFLLIHGMADDNVVFRHSIKLMAEMQKRGAQNMQVMTYPGEKHGFRTKANKIHRDQQILDFFVQQLGE